VEVVLDAAPLAQGQGRTKRLAERAAASAALEKLG
jgi:dsRNA-specific ribonuclease